MKRVLYVENNEDAALLVKTLLLKAGFETSIALTGKDGVKKAKNEKNNYDLILLDVMISDMSGWGIFETLKDRIKAKYIFLSPFSISSERLAEMKKAGISDYIITPFQNRDFVKKIKNVCDMNI